MTMSIKDWMYLIIASVVLVFALAYGILCIRHANHIINKCKKVQEELKPQLPKEDADADKG